MANFCRDCTIEMFGEEVADRNELRSDNMVEGEMRYDLCEGCGWGWFLRDGTREAPSIGHQLPELRGAKAKRPSAS